MPTATTALAPLESFAEACFQLSPQIAVRAGEAVFLEIGKGRNLFSEETVKLRLRALARRFGLSGRVAIADTAGLALAQARYTRAPVPKERLLFFLPCEALLELFSPFGRPREEDEKALLQLLGTLEQLGIQDVAGFASLAPAELASRFGRRGAELHARLRAELRPEPELTGEATAWPGFRPVERVLETAQVECEDVEALLFILKGLVDRAMARLRGRAERAAAVELRLEFEKWSTLKEPVRSWRIELPVPQGSASGLLPILRDRLSRSLDQRGLVAPIREVTFEIVETAPGRGAQRDFFNRKEEESEAWESLMGRLSQKLGKGQVFVAHPMERHLPERAFTRSLEPQPPGRPLLPDWADQAIGPRPSRILPQPEPLEREGEWLTKQEKRWHALSWEGPERLSGEWWRGPSFEGFYRDYYKVTTEEGEQLWVFRNRKSAEPSFYLHGYFD